MIFSRNEWPTPQEEELEAEIYALLAARFPNASVQVAIRVCCRAMAGTNMTCDKPLGHAGKHRIDCKDHDFTHDCRPEWEEWRKEWRKNNPKKENP